MNDIVCIKKGHGNWYESRLTQVVSSDYLGQSGLDRDSTMAIAAAICRPWLM